MTILDRIINKIKFVTRHYIVRPVYTKYIMLNYNAKRETIIDYATKFNCDVFVETGTFLGETVQFMKDHFNELHSFELQPELARDAIIKFKSFNNVYIYEGNSSHLLPSLLPNMDEGIIFWLDAHYSSEFWLGDRYIVTAKGEKETPIVEELQVILKFQQKINVILIDDARCFNGKNDYPTKKELLSMLYKNGISKNQILIKNDIIRIIL